ncbi:MAG: recombination regulator RecX [Betaproteobacteria bacterium]|nr:recombination regulator RecX [Betaproteobacteria bacterium]MDE2622286.1 recombination regulator RecX [Betaproteobacteria bacterium]
MSDPDLRARALALLGRREHTRHELARKLSVHADTPEILDALLESLTEEGLLSDARAAEAVLRVRSGRHGLLRIRQEFQQRGVPEDVAASALETAREGELASARQVWSKKFSQLPANAEERARQGRYLQNRGFSLSVIRQVLRSED